MAPRDFRKVQRLAQVAFCQAIADGKEGDSVIEAAEAVFEEHRYGTYRVEGDNSPFMLVTNFGDVVNYPQDYYSNYLRPTPPTDVETWHRVAGETAEDLRKEIILFVYEAFDGYYPSGRFSSLGEALKSAGSRQTFYIVNDDTEETLHSAGDPYEEEEALSRCRHW